MFDTQRVRKDFSDAASQYDNYAALQQKVLSTLAERSRPLLKPDARLLDAGCGTGRLARELKGYDIIQMDIAFAMCIKAAKAGLPTFNGAVESLPFAEGTFDGVFCSLVLQWVPHWREALAEMRRILKPGGVLAVSTFGPDTLKELKESFAAVDRYSHVSDFLPRGEFEHTETMTEYYPDLLALMRHLKAIGARNKLLGRRKSLMSRGQLQRLEKRYTERFATKSGLPVTWEILTSVNILS